MSQAMKAWPGLSNYPGLTLRAQLSSIICFGYKEFGTRDKPKIINAWDFKSWAKNINDDIELLKITREILASADAIVTHNGKRFDWKFFQTRLLMHGMKPLPPIPHMDTCSISKRHLFLLNNKLDTLGEHLVDERKIDNGGWDLWVRVSKREKKALKEMSDYCVQDVVVLEKIFKKLRPFMNEMPNYNIFSTGRIPICPKCGSTRIYSNGTRPTKTRTYRRYICRDCHSWSRTDVDDKNPRSF